MAALMSAMSSGAQRAAPANVQASGAASSRVGFGTGGLLRIGSARERQNVLAAALANGITHFDTAPIYGFGEAERALGRFLGGQRARVTLTTKFGLRPSPLAARLAPLQRAARSAIKQFPLLRQVAVRNTGPLYSSPCFSATAIRHSLESSLRALRTDYVDFFLAHQASGDSMPAEEAVGVLETLRAAGKIRAFGVATEFDWLLPVLQARPQLAGVAQFDSEVGRGNVARLRVESDGLIITYGFISRAIAVCRERMRSASSLDGLERADDDTLGALLLRATMLENANGIVLMQSRSISRIERNMRAAHETAADDRVRRLVGLLEPQR
jgi:aryl-alcohol dehydrogenase-like predicted oxidoreductase